MPSPDVIFSQWSDMMDNDFEKTIRKTFDLPTTETDSYIYEAESFASPLSKIQNSLETGIYKYKYRQKDEQINIPVADITAYNTIFSSMTDTAKALKSFAANARKTSPRESVARYLLGVRIFPDSPQLKVPKQKSAQVNPYYGIWVWSCQEADFLGPLNLASYASPAAAKQIHPILPVLYHHFGCICPTFEALSVIKQLAASSEGKGVVDMGSGNGYWSYMLRRMGVIVTAVDSMASIYRWMWIEDTVKANGIEWLKKNGGAKEKVLLMVYPVTQGRFTENVLRVYTGNTIVVAGTQNANRLTGFANQKIEEYFEREKADFELVVRAALPSFAGKDDALYVY